MRRSLVLLTIASAALLVVVSLAPTVFAQDDGTIFVPASSIPRPEDAGVRAHTNFIVNVDPNLPAGTCCGPNWETPASLACVYQLVKPVQGCPIKTTTTNPSGGVGAIALVDAYDNPDAVTDMNTYVNQWGLPAPTFQVVYATGTEPPNDPGGWSEEEALDIEMAVAAAPKAKIFLVEAASNNNSDLYYAENVAANLVASNGGGFVSNSWSGSEYAGEANDEKTYFNTPKVVYFASTGDSGLNNIGPPAVFSTVVAAGGTDIIRSNGQYESQSWWPGGGGGKSQFISRPTYQNVIQGIVGSARGIPDMAADASPGTGPAMYDADGNIGWTQIGGTSVSSPYLAGVMSGAGHLAPNSTSGLTLLYKEYANANEYKAYWTDITTGGSECTVGWDFCTGVGTPLTFNGK